MFCDSVELNHGFLLIFIYLLIWAYHTGHGKAVLCEYEL